MNRRAAWSVRMLWVGIWLAPCPAGAINVQIDYTYDISNFFGSGNPQGASAGAQARAALEAAANFYSKILTDNFDAITIPATYHSSVPGSNGLVAWAWQEDFENPSDGTQSVLGQPTVGQNQYVVYVGGRSLPGSSAGQGTPGTFLTGAFMQQGSFTTSDMDNIHAIDEEFVTAVNARGQSSGFVRWGGSIAFDNDGSTNWFFDHQSLPSQDTVDFYSVALRELAHTLGFGGLTPKGPHIVGQIDTTVWPSLIGGFPFGNGYYFIGGNAMAQNDGNRVPLTDDQASWMPGQTSLVYGSLTGQEALMVPDVPIGMRKKLTELDAAALKDIGWSLAAVPEPAVPLLAVIGSIGCLFAFRRNNR